MRLLLALAALLGVALDAHADFQADYIAGIKALQQGRKADAQAALQRAFDAQPSPIDKIDIEGNWQPYIPLHYLGGIALDRGDCAAAANYWDNPANRRMLGRLNNVRVQEQQKLATCVAAPAPPVAAANKPAETASATKPVVAAPPPAEKPAPPEALKQALQHYLGGRYAEAARIDPATLADARAKFHAYLIRAAARFMLAHTGGDAGLVDLARADARSAHALDARAAPDAATFPPRFVAFYAAAR